MTITSGQIKVGTLINNGHATFPRVWRVVEIEPTKWGPVVHMVRHPDEKRKNKAPMSYLERPNSRWTIVNE